MDTQTDDTITLTRQLGLYALTLLLETPVVLLRVFVAWTIAAVALLITGHTTRGAGTWAVLGLWPTMWSVSALVPRWGGGRDSQIALACVLGLIMLTIATGHVLLAATITTFSLCVLISPWATGWWWRMRVGAREPSTREQEAYDDAMAILNQQSGGELPRPVDWFVLDSPDPEAAACGHTLLLTQALLDGPQLPAVLAHELGHLAALDGRLNAAINRLAIHPLREPRPDQERYTRQTHMLLTDDPTANTIIAVGVFAMFMRMLLRCCRGGLGLWLLRPLWGAEWRNNEYTADQYAAGLGLGEELAEFLRTNNLVYDQPVPFSWLTPHMHPPAELRVDRLTRNHQDDYSSDTGFSQPTFQAS